MENKRKMVYLDENFTIAIECCCFLLVKAQDEAPFLFVNWAIFNGILMQSHTYNSIDQSILNSLRIYKKNYRNIWQIAKATYPLAQCKTTNAMCFYIWLNDCRSFIGGGFFFVYVYVGVHRWRNFVCIIKACINQLFIWRLNFQYRNRVAVLPFICFT